MTGRFIDRGIRWLLLALLATVLVTLAVPRPRFRSLVIHHSASAADDRKSIARYHRSRFWLDAAYHLVFSNGSTEVPVGYLEATRWYLLSLPSLATSNPRSNLTSLQLCVAGNYESEAFPASLAPALGHAVGALQEKYDIPDERVLLHRDCGPTLCPGKHLTRDLIRQLTNTSGPGCAEAVKAQHESVIDGPYLFGGQVSRIWSAVGVVLVASILSLRLLRRRVAAVREVKPFR